MALIDAIVYGTFSVGYVCMLMLTERAAERFVRGQIPAQPNRAIRIRTDAACPSPAARTIFSARPAGRHSAA